MKIYLVGIVASGKTTFAKKLSKFLKFPMLELDSVVFVNTNESRKKQSAEQQMEVINEWNNSCEKWVFEGVYRP